MIRRESDAAGQLPGRSTELQVQSLVKRYGNLLALDDLSLSVEPGAFQALLGPSGSGKTSLLMSIAGFLRPDSGRILVNGNDVVHLPPERRNFGMVFQGYALFPHLTVLDNVAFALRARGVSVQERRKRAGAAIDLVRLTGREDHYPRQLSGGQQQRVALARAYASRPKAILLDEPLSNLDARLRVRMREEIKELQHKFDLSTIYVTHDQEEAMAISDRIIVMREGNIEQSGRPLEIYDTPRTRFVADFIGAANIIAGVPQGNSAAGGPVVKVGDALLECAPGSKLHAPDADGRHLVAVRTVYPEMRRAGSPRPNQWPGKIVRRVLLGDIVNYTVKWAGGELRLHAFPSDLFGEGEEVQIYIPAERAIPVMAD